MNKYYLLGIEKRNDHYIEISYDFFFRQEVKENFTKEELIDKIYKHCKFMNDKNITLYAETMLHDNKLLEFGTIESDKELMTCNSITINDKQYSAKYSYDIDNNKHLIITDYVVSVKEDFISKEDYEEMVKEIEEEVNKRLNKKEEKKIFNILRKIFS